MITLQTPNNLLLEEFNREMDGAQRWLNKKVMNSQGGNEMIALCNKCKQTHQPQTSRLIDYQPKSGNKWKLCYRMNYYDGEIDVVPCLLMYYKTIGSIGIFAPINIGYQTESIAQNGVVIFTSHFFHRYFNPERDKAADVSMDDAINFVCENIATMVKEGTDKDGRKTIDMRVAGGIARGYQRQGIDGGSPIFEIRTFLKDEQLNGYQSRETKTLRKFSDNHQYIPLDVAEEVIKNSNNPTAKAENYMTEVLASHGVPEVLARKIVKCMSEVNDFIYSCSSNIGDNGWDSIKEQAKKYCYEVMDYVVNDGGKQTTWDDIIRLCYSIGIKYGIQFDVSAAEKRVYTYYGDLSKPIDDNTNRMGLPKIPMANRSNYLWQTSTT